MSAKSMPELLHTAAMVLVVAGSGNTQAAPLTISDVPLFLNRHGGAAQHDRHGPRPQALLRGVQRPSDLDDDGMLDTSGYELKVPAPADDSPDRIYKINYFGYFDSIKCYTYSGPIEPTSCGHGQNCTGGAVER